MFVYFSNLLTQYGQQMEEFLLYLWLITYQLIRNEMKGLDRNCVAPTNELEIWIMAATSILNFNNNYNNHNHNEIKSNKSRVKMQQEWTIVYWAEEQMIMQIFSRRSHQLIGRWNVSNATTGRCSFVTSMWLPLRQKSTKCAFISKWIHFYSLSDFHSNWFNQSFVSLLPTACISSYSLPVIFTFEFKLIAIIWIDLIPKSPRIDGHLQKLGGFP